MISFSVTDRSITNFKQLIWGFLIVGALILVSDVTFQICFQIKLIVGEPLNYICNVLMVLFNKQ